MIGVSRSVQHVEAKKDEIKRDAERPNNTTSYCKIRLASDLGIEGPVPADSKIQRKITKKYNVSTNVYMYFSR